MNATTVTLILGALALITLITLYTLVALRAARREIRGVYEELRVMREHARREAAEAAHHREHATALLLQLKSFAIEARLKPCGEPLVAPRTPEQRAMTTEVTNPVLMDLEPVSHTGLLEVSNLLGEDE